MVIDLGNENLEIAREEIGSEVASDIMPDTPSDTAFVSATSIVNRVTLRTASCVEIVSQALLQARRVQDHCNAFTFFAEEEALAEARALDDALARGEKPGLLAGVPIAIKDMTPTKGLPTTLGSLVSGEGKTEHDAVIVERLKQAGAIVIGKTTTAEFAYSSFTQSRRYGLTRNPWDREHTAGGSSGGSAVAVAGGAVPLAEGSDMGGSVRIPAGACGVVGFKPSLGRIPMTIMPLGLETYSHFGPLARNVADAARFVAATAGHHPADMLSLTTPFDLEKTEACDLRGKRFALSIDLGYCAVHPDVEIALYKIADRLCGQGAVVEEISLPWERDVFDLWALRWNCLLGLLPNCETEDELALMDPALADCIRKGRTASARDLMAVELKRTQMNQDLMTVFSRFDALICPTNAIPAPPIDHTDADYEGETENGKLRAFDMAHPFNMVPTVPAISLPAGLTEEGLPIGLQLVGPPHANEALLSLANALEALLDPIPHPDVPN